MTSVRRKVAGGAVWVVLARTLDRSIGFVSTLILARLLVPADFGIVALALSVAGLLDQLRSFGFEVVLVRTQDAGRELYDTVWTLNLLFALLVSLLLVLAAQPAAAFYDNPKLVPLMYFIALRPLLEGSKNVGVVNFQKELRFDLEFRYRAVSRIAGFVIAIPLAFWLRSYWALSIGMVGSAAAQLVLSYVLHPYRPRISFSAVRETLGFSSWLALSNAVQFVVKRSPDFVIGKLVGAHALGLFSMAYELGYMPASELSTPINRAVFPGYATQGADTQALARGFLEVSAMLALLVLPFGVGLALVAEFVVPVLLGEKWRAAIPLVAMLSVYGTIKAVTSNTAFIILVRGRPSILFALGAIESLILVPLLLLGVLNQGVTGACWAYLASACAIAPIVYAWVLTQLEIGPLRFLVSLWRPLVATGVMAVAVQSVVVLLPAGGSGVALLDELLICSAIGGLAYVASVLALWKMTGSHPGPETFVLNAAGEALPIRQGLLGPFPETPAPAGRGPFRFLMPNGWPSGRQIGERIEYAKSES